MCLVSFRSGRSYLELQITVIPQLELLFIVTAELAELFGADLLTGDQVQSGIQTCAIPVLERILLIILELELVFGVTPEQE